MKIQTIELLDELVDYTQNHLTEIKEWLDLPLEILQKRPHPDSWSALECIEHLNYYGNFYLVEIENQMNRSHLAATKEFKAGILGNYFAKSMLPKAKGGKMKTFNEMNPMGKKLDKSVLETFIAQLNQMLQILETARNKDLNRIKTSISISKWIKLKLGDTLRIVIYHNHRHILQAKKALIS